ncbi:hypothetical protein BJY24_002726 [Nocardia transvalensis]|uniref:Uncharacterized protein n=1 Tax=Nocardia transvalensis TaxID=37333 RepID=A0A7W9PDX3_9NOCA|nr:hypothetical protein [Nocardia transvalensis]MBB5913859.1 hypothetical protein [Nocardia transvalensis]
MTAPESGRAVVRPLPPRGRTTPRHAARRSAGPARHTVAPGRHVPRPVAMATGPGRHAAPVRRKGIRHRPAHAGLDAYDRLLLWFAGWLLSIRIALVGENPIDEMPTGPHP